MLKTRNRETILLDACIKAKQPFVIDNTNPMRSDRLKYIEKMKAHKFKIKGYYFQSKISECLDRNEMRNAMERIPEVGVKSTYNKLEVPSYDEGFNELYFVYLKGHEFVVEAWKNEV